MIRRALAALSTDRAVLVSHALAAIASCVTLGVWIERGSWYALGAAASAALWLAMLPRAWRRAVAEADRAPRVAPGDGPGLPCAGASDDLAGVPVIVARYVAPRRLDLRDLYDSLACEALERWRSGSSWHAEICTVEALDRARGLTVTGAVLGERGARC